MDTTPQCNESVDKILRQKSFLRVDQLIDHIDYSRLPKDLVYMFASFSLTSARKGYVPTFSA